MQTVTVNQVVAKTLVFDAGGRLLVLKRSDDDEHRPGGWDFPGGQVDEGEAVLDGAIREAAEEAGLKLDPADMRLSFASSKTAFRKSAGTNVNTIWLGYTTGLPEDATVTLSHEHSAYKWLTLSEFMNVTSHPAHHELVGYMRRNRISADLWDR